MQVQPLDTAAGYNRRTMNSSPSTNRMPAPARAIRLRWPLACVSAVLACLLAAVSDGLAQERHRYEACLADGSRLFAARLTEWSPTRPTFKLDERQIAAGPPAARWVRDQRAAVGPPPASWVETWTGDCLPGEVIRFVDPRESPYRIQPAHWIVRTLTVSRPPQLELHAPIRVVAKAVRRIVWQQTFRHYRAGTVVLTDGRQFEFRAARWEADSVNLLTESGPRTFSFTELAELNLPLLSPWTAYFDELAVVAPDPEDVLFQAEAAHGLVATTSWRRQRTIVPPDPEKSVHWIHGIQPAWSLDVIWLPGSEIATRRFFAPWEVPLSRVIPDQVSQRSSLAQNGRPWQRDRSVEGTPLRCGAAAFGWGFGVHATNELHFPLPPFDVGFRCQVGLDQLAGDGGCVQARVLLDDAVRHVVYESPLLVGSDQTVGIDIGKLPGAAAQRRLILEMNEAHATRPVGADPLDIRDSADWLDPILVLDRPRLAETLVGRTERQIAAWSQWQIGNDPPPRLRFSHVWDELSDIEPAFRLAVCVDGTVSLRLRQIRRLQPEDRFLVVVASCPRQSAVPIHVRVSANRASLASFDVPVLDRNHLQLSPLVIPLESLRDSLQTPVEFEIQQSPGTLETPVQWHAIHFAQHHPTTYEVFDERGSWTSTSPGLHNPAVVAASEDAYSGLVTVRLTPNGESQCDLAPPLAIREFPEIGQYRYLRLAFRKRGGGQIRFRLVADVDGQSIMNYVAGSGDGPQIETSPRQKPHQIFEGELNDRWTVVTRDLTRDFGEMNLRAIAVHVPDGRDAELDSVYLLRSLDEPARRPPADDQSPK